MLTHHLLGCFEERIGQYGVRQTELNLLQEQLDQNINAIEKEYHDGGLPFLSIVEKEDDIALWQAAFDQLARFDAVVVLGTGGSSLGGKTLYALADSGFGNNKKGPKLYFMDNVDPVGFDDLFAHHHAKDIGFLVISKSGSTAETLAQFLSCLSHYQKDAAQNHFVVITEPGARPLRDLAEKYNLMTLDHDPKIGGRFSVFSVVGLLPAQIAGLDVRAIRRGAQKILAELWQKETVSPLGEAVGIHYLLHKKHDVLSYVMMPYLDGLHHFSFWFRQLWAESLGKDGRGTTPINALGTVDQHSQLQLYLGGARDKAFCLIGRKPDAKLAKIKTDTPALSYLNNRNMDQLLWAEYKATGESLLRNGRPLRLIEIDVLDEETIGALLMHMMLETILLAKMWGINAFDQPAVEESKILTREYLATMA